LSALAGPGRLRLNDGDEQEDAESTPDERKEMTKGRFHVRKNTMASG
jgi:hypothetical protein